MNTHPCQKAISDIKWFIDYITIEECQYIRDLVTHPAYSYGEILCCLENLFPGEYVGNQKTVYHSINVKRQLK